MKLLFFDIDGTLVSFNTHCIPQSTIDAVRRAKASGQKVIISTGRPKMIINNLGPLQQAGLIDGYITMNGSYCFVGDKVLYKGAIPADDVEAIVTKAEEMDVPCIMVGEHEMVAAGGNDLVHEIFSHQLGAPEIARAHYDWHKGKEIFQLTPFFTLDQQSAVEAAAKGCEFGRWHPAFIDITAKGNTKAHGLDVIAKYFGVPMEQTVAFGDGGNDVPMLEHAGIGVAMGNASDDVKARADMVTTSVDDDGIANALNKIL